MSVSEVKARRDKETTYRNRNKKNMAYSLTDAIFEIVEKLNQISCEEKSKQTVWEGIISDIEQKNSIRGGYINLVEKEISSFFKRINDEDKIFIWRNSESGMIESEDVEQLSIGSIEMDLESELLDEITKYAFEEVH